MWSEFLTTFIFYYFGKKEEEVRRRNKKKRKKMRRRRKRKRNLVNVELFRQLWLYIYIYIFNHQRSKFSTFGGQKNSYMDANDLDEFFQPRLKFGQNFWQKIRVIENTVNRFFRERIFDQKLIENAFFKLEIANFPPPLNGWKNRDFQPWLSLLLLLLLLLFEDHI